MADIVAGKPQISLEVPKLYQVALAVNTPGSQLPGVRHPAAGEHRQRLPGQRPAAPRVRVRDHQLQPTVLRSSMPGRHSDAGCGPEHRGLRRVATGRQRQRDVHQLQVVPIRRFRLAAAGHARRVRQSRRRCWSIHTRDGTSTRPTTGWSGCTSTARRGLTSTTSSTTRCHSAAPRRSMAYNKQHQYRRISRPGLHLPCQRDRPAARRHPGDRHVER